jgi:hypothetical protein
LGEQTGGHELMGLLSDQQAPEKFIFLTFWEPSKRHCSPFIPFQKLQLFSFQKVPELREYFPKVHRLCGYLDAQSRASQFSEYKKCNMD